MSQRVTTPYVAIPARSRCAFEESGCLGMQPKTGGKLHLKLNTGTRPIANKYREGNMKRTEKRVKKYVKPLKGKRMELAIRPARFSCWRSTTRAPSIRMDEARAGAACGRRTSGERASASLGVGRQGPEEGGPALAAGC